MSISTCKDSSPWARFCIWYFTSSLYMISDIYASYMLIKFAKKKKNIFRQFLQFVRFYNQNYEFFNFKIRKMFWFYICYYVVLRTKIRKWIWINSFYFEKQITLIPKRNYSCFFEQNIRKINIQKFLGFLAFFLPKKRTCQLNVQILW